jgi:hypothetical protein
MEFMVIRKADAETEAGVMPSKQLIDDMTAFNEKLVQAGAMKAGAGLLARSGFSLVSFSNGKPTVIDGPFAEAKELIAGYSIIEAKSLAEVIELVKQWPQSDGHGNVQVEIRPLATAESLGFTDEQQDRYDKMVQQQMQQ